MRMIINIVLTFLVFVPHLSMADQAPAPQAQPKKDWVLPGDISVGGQIGFESDGDAPKVLVRAEFRGFRAGTKDPTVTYRYFWVKASVGVKLGGGDENPGEEQEARLNSVLVSIVPVTKAQVLNPTTNTTVRFVPIEIRRNMDLGLDSSVSIQAIGLMYNTEKPLIGRTISAFANLAVDLIGLRVMNFQGQDPAFVGAQLGVVSAVGGLSWNLNQSVSLRVAIGGKENVALSSGGFSTESDLYGKLELLLKHAHQKYSLWAASGFYDFRAPGVVHDETYLLIGLTVTF